MKIKATVWIETRDLGPFRKDVELSKEEVEEILKKKAHSMYHLDCDTKTDLTKLEVVAN